MPIDALDALAKVPLLSGLERKDLQRLAKDFKERVFQAGETVVKQGDERGIGFFVITDGKARVSIDGKDIDVIGAGDHFGEVALIGDRTRTATVTAETELRTLVMTIWEFRAFVQSDGEVAWRLLQHVARLVREPPAGS